MASQRLPVADLDHILANTAELWEDVRGKKVFLTGGTGFFGAWLIESFQHANSTLDLDAELVALTRDPDRARARLGNSLDGSETTLHIGDVRDFEGPRGTFDFVVHAATESSHQLHDGDAGHMLATIVEGTRRVLDFARESGTKRFLVVSSGAVYGPQPPEIDRLPESYVAGPDVWDPRSAYAEGKRVAEMMCAIEGAAGHFSTRAARCFTFVGPHIPLDAHFAIGNFIGDALAGGPIRIRGDGTPVRSYMYMADLAAWLWTLTLSPAATGAYNVGSEHAVSILETARLVADVCALGDAVELGAVATPGIRPQRYVPCTSRAQRELSLAQRIALPDSVRRTLGWLTQAG